MIKISFIGDIMSNCRQIQLCSKYGYDFVFDKVKNDFINSDLLVGNLETPLTKQNNYSTQEYLFNAPYSLAISLKKNFPNIFLLTANNHCLDNNYSGLVETISILDELNIPHCGTSLDDEPSKTISINGLKIILYNYTYGTNAWSNNVYLKENQMHSVCLLQPQELSSRFKSICEHAIPEIMKKVLRRLHFMQFNLPIYERYSKHNKYFKSLLNTIKNDSSELIKICCFHVGGQYNLKPNNFSKYVARKSIKYGADFVIENHEHRIQNITKYRDKCIVYSLGNFVGENGVVIPPYDKDSDFSLCMHAYISSKASIRFSFSIYHTYLDKETGIVKPISLYEEIKSCVSLNDKKKLIDKNNSIVCMLLNKSAPLQYEYFID